ncbi:MAG: rhamnulokinase [Anaerolineae bacterium]|nr:rhamnulokinase [Anaerolineae bacterium]
MTVPLAASAVTALALDLGAESGRAVRGQFDGDRLHMDVLHRFPNRPVHVSDGLHWDVLALYAGMLDGLSQAHAQGGEIGSVGLDTWGVDFALLGRDNTLVGLPYHYRDRRTEGMLDLALARVGREALFRATGIQFLGFNTLYQLLAMRQAGAVALDAAHRLLMIPDLFNFWLSGAQGSEWTVASTSQMCDARTGDWNRDLLNQLDLPIAILPPILSPGSVLGPLRPEVQQTTGLGASVQVIAPACHDTGAAVVGVPLAGPRSAYLSSGTWSLVGAETTAPVLTDAALAANLTNEGGVDGTTRLLKNISGLWLVQECQRAWARQGHTWSYAELAQIASDAPPFGPLVNPNAPDLLAPPDMPAALRRFCQRSGQPAPTTEGALMRVCLESLALAYRQTLEQIEGVLGFTFDRVHIVGGGSQHTLLCQLTADACGKPVMAGPVEATAIGNLVVQLRSLGWLASLAEGRDLVRRSFAVTEYEPRPDPRWDEAYARFIRLSEA